MKQLKKILLLIALVISSNIGFAQWCGVPDSSFCPGNRFTNGDFELGTGDPSLYNSNDIDLATGWGPIWQGNSSLADLACGGTSHASSSLVAATPNTGVYAGMWVCNFNHSWGSGAREGMFNELQTAINPNTGNYSFNFRYSVLNNTPPNNTNEVGIWGIFHPSANPLPATPTGVFAPLTADLFGAGNAVLLGTVTSLPGEDNTWKNANVTFNSSMAGFPSQVTHILISHSDNVIPGGMKYMGFDEFCLQEKKDDPDSLICQEVSIQAIKDSQTCCYDLRVVNNYNSQYFTSIKVKSNNLNISSVQDNLDWGIINYQNSKEVEFTDISPSFLPKTSPTAKPFLDIAKLCFAGVGNDIIDVEFIGPAPDYRIVCTKQFQVTNCNPHPVDTNCASAAPYITCDSGVLNFNFIVKNHSNFTARGVTIYPQTAGVNDNRIFVPIADLLPGDTSTLYKVPISIDDTTGVACFHLAICDVNADPLISGIPPQNCCMDSIEYCAQVPSCEPCDAIDIRAVQQDGGNCCFDLSITNNYLEDDIACLRFIGKNGAQFALFSGWNIQGPVSSNNITACAPGGKIGKGTFTDFAEFCLTGTSVSPHLVVVEFLNAAGEVLCVKDLDFPDCTLVPPTCANIVNDSLYCDGSKMYYTFDVQNNSPFDICQFDIRTSDSTVKTTPSFIQLKPCIMQGQTAGPFTITIDTARADLDFLCLYLTGHNAAYNPDSNIAATQCCTDSMGVICLPFIPCDSISNCCDVNKFIIPTGITPNGDGFNDIYQIQNSQACDKVAITVFNRWGNIVFKNPDFKNDWQGENQNGSLLPQGTYYILIETPNGNKKGIYLDLRY